MAFVLTHWSISRNGAALDMRYIGPSHTDTSPDPSYATAIEVHRGLSDLADNETETGDDQLSIITQTPSDRGGADTNITLLNGCNIDDASSEHIYDGSITQAGGDTIYDGIQVFGNSSSIQVIQNGARLTNDFWNQPAMKAATSDALSSTTHRFVVKVRDAAADIDGRRLLGTQRVLGTGYTEFFIGGGTNRGNNVLALTANNDGNNATVAGTIATWTDIVNTIEGYNTITIGAGSYTFYSSWDVGSRTKNELYERAKWIQREGSVETIYGIAGDIFRGITHELDVDTPTGTFSMVAAEQVTWSGGTGQLLAINSATAATKMWIQLLSGVVPTDGQVITGTTSTATVTLNVTVTPRLISPAFVGNSTGAAINPGAFGLGIESADLTQNDLMVDLTDTPRTPPNNVTYTVSNTIAGDYVLSTNNNAGDIDFAQFATNATYSGAITAIVVTTAIPTDTPASGTIRIELDNGSYQRVSYLSYAGSTFDVTGTTLTATSTSGNNLFISYIDRVATGTSETVTYVYNAPRTLFTRVRNANDGVEIKTFETTATVGSGGGSSTVGRINDF